MILTESTAILKQFKKTAILFYLHSKKAALKAAFFMCNLIDLCRTDCYFDGSGRRDLDLKAGLLSENHEMQTEIPWPKKKQQKPE